MAKKIRGGMKSRRIAGDVATYIFLIAMCALWLVPFFWLVMQSFRDGKGQFISTFLPTEYTLNNYKALFTEFGCDRILDGGETMNTSSQEFLNAIEKLDADSLVLSNPETGLVEWACARR